MLRTSFAMGRDHVRRSQTENSDIFSSNFWLAETTRYKRYPNFQTSQVCPITFSDEVSKCHPATGSGFQFTHDSLTFTPFCSKAIFVSGHHPGLRQSSKPSVALELLLGESMPERSSKVLVISWEGLVPICPNPLGKKMGTLRHTKYIQ